MVGMRVLLDMLGWFKWPVVCAYCAAAKWVLNTDEWMQGLAYRM
jgi:hypothetical protein